MRVHLLMISPPLRPYILLLLLAGSGLGVGCSIFRTDKEDSGLRNLWSELRQNDAPGAVPSQTIRSAVLEANIVRRPSVDTRVRSLVWEDLDESGVMQPEERQRLNHAGFRAGIAGSSTPWVLQNLANDATKAAVSHNDDGASAVLNTSFQQPVGPAFNLFENGITQIEVQSNFDPSLIPFEKISVLSELKDPSDLRCVLQISAEELEDGWVLLSVLPQLYSGANALRLSVSGNHDRLPVRQKILPLYEQQFRMKLHRGEVAVIGQYETSEWTVGRLFFQPDTGTGAKTSLLMIRLVSTNELHGTSERPANAL
jgi:hypothetical protein